MIALATFGRPIGATEQRRQHFLQAAGQDVSLFDPLKQDRVLLT